MRCGACGSELLVPSERRITIDRGKVFEAPVPAVECTECGKMFAAERSSARVPPPDD
jgi:ribosomal protein S27E